MSLFVDANVLLYAIDPNEPAKRAIAREFLTAAMAADSFVLATQCLTESYAVARRKFGIPAETLRASLLALTPWCIDTPHQESLRLAFEIEGETGYRIWDCLLLANAICAECAYFVSEDLQDGRNVRGVRIVDPFRHPLSAILPAG